MWLPVSRSMERVNVENTNSNLEAFLVTVLLRSKWSMSVHVTNQNATIVPSDLQTMEVFTKL